MGLVQRMAVAVTAAVVVTAGVTGVVLAHPSSPRLYASAPVVTPVWLYYRCTVRAPTSAEP